MVTLKQLGLNVGGQLFFKLYDYGFHINRTIIFFLNQLLWSFDAIFLQELLEIVLCKIARVVVFLKFYELFGSSLAFVESYCWVFFDVVLINCIFVILAINRHNIHISPAVFDILSQLDPFVMHSFARWTIILEKEYEVGNAGFWMQGGPLHCLGILNRAFGFGDVVVA